INLMKRLLDETGHEEVLFPTLIPEELIGKEAEHIAKFEEEIFWVTRGGKESLSHRLALRPTSETAIMEMFKLWIHSHTDLPIKIYQVVSVFRCETKATAPMIRLREISMFKEAHTAHRNREEAEEQVKEAINIYKEFFERLAIPFIISIRPEWDKFAGAVYTIAFDTLMPDGKTLQIGTVHYLGTNFSKAFDVTYLTPQGTHEYVHTTSYGISERVIAALIAVHGDDHGLVLPPFIAPIQIVIVPIMYGEDVEVLNYSKEVFEELRKKGYRVVLDDRRDITPGEKYYYWELRGVPLRIEIGPRDLKQKEVTLVRRDTFKRVSVSKESYLKVLEETLNKIHCTVRERAYAWFNIKFHKARNLKEVWEILEERKGVVEVPWCGNDECGLKLEEEVKGNVLGYDINEDKSAVKGEKCIICGKDAEHWIRVARRY
ncbi:MAG: proline--tRNA ligase, partial [Thermoprotei archaeon]